MVRSTAVGVRAPATTANLGPGFDAFGMALTLYLEATAVPRPRGGPRVMTEGEGAGELSDGSDNLVWRALATLCRRVGVAPPEMTVRVRSAIPLERGLGSSAAAIVAGLGLARAARRLEISDQALIHLAAELEGHPDNVAAATLGGLVCVARPENGAPVVRRIQPHRRLRPVVLVPETRQVTAGARRVVPSRLTREAAVDQAARAGHVLAGLLGAWPVDPGLAGDQMHEPPRLAAMAGSGQLVTALRRAGLHAWLSGAGPAVAVAVPRRDVEGSSTCRRLAAEHGFASRAVDWDLAGLATST